MFERYMEKVRRVIFFARTRPVHSLGDLPLKDEVQSGRRSGPGVHGTTVIRLGRCVFCHACRALFT